MSIIVWDGSNIASDSLFVDIDSGMKSYEKKLIKVSPNVFLGFVGDAEIGKLLVSWAVNSKEDVNQWPEEQIKEGDALLIVARKIPRECYYYERFPNKQQVESPFMAWGSGAQIATGALAMGATAKEAVRVTIKYNLWCGGRILTSRWQDE